jgi:hypothetical protein
MRHTFRRIFNSFVAGLPPWMLRGFFKTFITHQYVAERAGFQVYPKVFYSPLPDPSEIDEARLGERRDLPGIEINLEKSLELLRQLCAFAPELEQFPRNPATHSIEWHHTYPSFDTATLYAMLRHVKPKRYVEVGCGYSTRVSAAAIRRNANDGVMCECTFIEPFPAPHFQRDELPGEFIQRKVQDVPLEIFRRLSAGDVLFIDTSHVIKVQNDVEHELLRILPSLAAGVHVHVHDIMTPYDYPPDWLVGNSPTRGGNNEQYALECLLSGGSDWIVTLPVHYLWRERLEALQQLLPKAVDRPAAFWIRKQSRSRHDSLPIHVTSNFA